MSRVSIIILMFVCSICRGDLNVTNYGAVGDAIQFYANTTSNSVIVKTTNTFTGGDIGKSIEVFGCGTVNGGINSYGTNGGNQDIVAIITNIVNGTNLYITATAKKSLTNAFTTVGHDNSTNIQAALDAATGVGTTIHIPAGSFLCLPPAPTHDCNEAKTHTLKKLFLSF